MVKNTFDINTSNLKKIAYAIYQQIYAEKTVVFMCVGTDKVVADSLAPIIAETLKKKFNIKAYVYGGLDYNINATNLIQCYNYIKTIHAESKIVLVDATLGENVGSILITNGAFAGMGNTLPSVKIGDISILGVVGKKGKDFRLNTVRLNDILNMAKLISKAIAMAMSLRCKNK